jgi:hypothetical protein
MPTPPLPQKTFWLTTFLDSPANRSGVEYIVITAAAAAWQWFFLHQVPAQVDLIGIALGVLRIAAPDNTVTQAQMGKVIGDVLLAVKTPTAETVKTVVTDAETVAGELKSTETKNVG